MFCEISIDCLSEEIFEEFSHEESHYRWRSFQRKTCKISQEDTKHLINRKFKII